MKDIIEVVVILAFNITCMLFVSNPILSHINAMASGALMLWAIILWRETRSAKTKP